MLKDKTEDGFKENIQNMCPPPPAQLNPLVPGELRHAATTYLLRVTGVCDSGEAVPSASLNMVSEA